MKKITTLALLTCNLCFGSTLEEEQARFDDVDFYVTFVYDQYIEPEFKLSYLLTLSQVYTKNKQFERAEDCMRWIRFMLWKFPELHIDWTDNLDVEEWR
jgi:hypothetical protein